MWAPIVLAVISHAFVYLFYIVASRRVTKFMEIREISEVQLP